jgi:hypothetical protein
MDGDIEWLADESLEVPVVVLTLTDTDEPSGTRVTVALACGEYADKFSAIAALDDMFDWAGKPKPLEYVLRTRTAIGNTGRCFDKPPATDIVTVLKVGEHEATPPYEFLLPTESAYARQSTYTKSEYVPKYADGRLSSDAKRYRALVDKIAGNVGRDDWLNFSASIIVCGRIGMTRLAAEYEVGKEFKNESLETSTGYHLALDGMPTGIELFEGQVSGFEQRYFVLVDATLRLSAQLDSGRKGISSYFAGLIVKAIEQYIKSPVKDAQGNSLPKNPTLRTFATLMLDPEGDPGLDRNMLEKYTEQCALPELGIGLGLRKEPDDENEVIALFSELIGRSRLPGYSIIFLSQATRYDAVFEYDVELNDRTVYLDANVESLGLGTRAQEMLRKGDKRYVWDDNKGVKWFAAEFKTRVQDILADRRFRQSISDLYLLISWDADVDKITALGGSLDRINPLARPLYGITHELTYQGDRCYCILLKDVVDRLRASA